MSQPKTEAERALDYVRRRMKRLEVRLEIDRKALDTRYQRDIKRLTENEKLFAELVEKERGRNETD